MCLEKGVFPQQGKTGKRSEDRWTKQKSYMFRAMVKPHQRFPIGDRNLGSYSCKVFYLITIQHIKKKLLWFLQMKKTLNWSKYALRTKFKNTYVYKNVELHNSWNRTNRPKL